VDSALQPQSRQLHEHSTVAKEARVTILTAAQCKALLACLQDGTLVRSCGAWRAERNADHRISSITIADLGREGLLNINISGKHKSAHLTEKGSWFARTLAAAHSDP